MIFNSPDDWLRFALGEYYNDIKGEEEMYIIWNPKGSNPIQSHPTEERAIREANRLALKHPGDVFYVCKIVKGYKGVISVVESYVP
jgi:hypothetical protein